MKNTENPSTEQLEALKAWAALYGRNWKSSLRDAWMTGDYGSFEQSNYLQQVRNTFGPSWLVSFVLPKDYEAATDKAVAEGIKLARGIFALRGDHFEIHLKESELAAQLTLAFKHGVRAAMLVARELLASTEEDN